MCGQPTLEGIKNVLEKVTGTIYPKDGQIIWLNLRQEPDIYVNGQPICARPPNKIGEYAELGAVTRDIIKADEAEFFKVVEGRVKENGGKLKYVTIAKYRFASKTLMRILPAPVKAEVEGFIEKKTISLDLYGILGKCTWKPV